MRGSFVRARRGIAMGAALLCLVGVGGLPGATAAAAAVAPVGQGFTVTASDLAYILKQIKVAERHVATLTPANPCGTLLGSGASQVPDTLTPYGLRTVDGSCNDLTPGAERFAASDQPFTRLTTPTFRDADPVPTGFGPPGPTSYRQTSGNVFDAQPRTISNLIDDQTAGNPAAVAAAGPAPVNQGRTLFIPNVATDAGLTPPYNSLFTFFGQFFDHGLDQTVKSGGTVFVPLQADDPLRTLGPDGDASTPDQVPADQAFMVLTRSRQVTGDGGVPSAPNTDTPWVDQSQTYSSHASHQVFLREYTLVAGKPVATGRLLGGSGPNQTGLPTWADVKKQAHDLLGLELGDADVTNVPMLATDPYGEFIPGPNGLPQYVTSSGTVEGDLASPVPPTGALHFDTPFVTDIAHAADPASSTYDKALLDAHFACGDGRCNENIALSAIHQVFHSEHDRLAADIDATLALPANQSLSEAYRAPGGFSYGDRLFQAARFVNEMEYQHLVFEEFARKVAPNIPAFRGYEPDANPAISMEFAQAVYRFGHSMLVEDVARTDADGSPNNVPLLTAFLNPPEYFKDKGKTYTPEQAAGAIIMGSSDQPGNEMDEFVTETLRNNLLGLPLDLPAINIARAREAGVPPLNDVRRQLAAANPESGILPYDSWAQFGFNLKHRESLVNFVAAYGRHPSIVDATTLKGKRDAARAIVAPGVGDVPPTDAAEFLGSAGAWAAPKATGLDDVDLWVGGLAEALSPAGGMLGSTFNYVFETQLTSLQNADRFYYLSRAAGMNLLSQLEGNSFAEIIMRNTDGTRTLKADAFGTADCKFELGNLSLNGSSSPCDESKLLTHLGDTVTYVSNGDPRIQDKQSVYNGTDQADNVVAGKDSDTIWGGDGADVLNGGKGDDVTIGGNGNDVIRDDDGIDILKGGPGNDAVQGGTGADLLLGGDGADLLNGGTQDNQSFGGPGNDLIVAGTGSDAAQGDGGDDWIETSTGKDTIAGDSNSPLLDDAGESAPGNDVLLSQGADSALSAEGGDDVMSNSDNVETFGGNGGYDWAIHQFDATGADIDMKVNALVGPLKPSVQNVDAWQETEAVSGSSKNDTILGDDVVPRTRKGGGLAGCDVLDQHGVTRIAGLAALLPTLSKDLAPVVASSLSGACPLTGNVWGEGNILLGGAGNDTIEGRGGDDIIAGDKALQVSLSVRDHDTGAEVASTDQLGHLLVIPSGTTTSIPEGLTLEGAVTGGFVDPADVVVVREIVNAPTNGNDTAVFSGAEADYTVTTTAGVTTVRDNRAGANDGTDTLFGIDHLVFKTVVLPGAGTPPPAPTEPSTPTAPGESPRQQLVRPALVSDLRAADVCTGCAATIAGAVEPFRGATLELSRQTGPGVFTPVARSTVPASATNGQYAFALPTKVSGEATYRVTVSGAGLQTTAGPDRTLRVFRVSIVRVRAAGRESVVLRNTGAVTVDLASWRLIDRAGRRLVLPTYQLVPGATVRVFTGNGKTRSGRIFAHKGIDLWAASHGRVRLRDAHGSQVAARRY